MERKTKKAAVIDGDVNKSAKQTKRIFIFLNYLSKY